MGSLHFAARATALALFLFAAPARALDTPPITALGWTRLPGAESCIATRDLARSVEQRLGRSAFASAARALVFIEGRIEPAPHPPGFHAHFVLSSADGTILGTRDLDTRAENCRAFDEELTLVAALLIDPNAALGPQRPSTPVMPSPSPPPTLSQSIPPEPNRPLREPWRESFDVGVAFAAGLLPGVSGGLLSRGEITPPHFIPIDVGGVIWHDGHTSTTENHGATLSLSYGFLSLCPLAADVSRTSIRGCIGGQIGALRAQGYGFPVSDAREQIVVQAALEGRIATRIVGPLEVDIGVSLALPIVRPRIFYVDSSGTEQDLYRMGAVAGIVGAGLGVAFP